jgi:hypothetical protein
MMRSLGATPSASGIAAHYASAYPGLVDVLVIDGADSAEAEAVAAHGIRPHVAETLIGTEARRRSLADELLKLAGIESA